MNWHIQRSRPRLVRGSLATSRRIEREEARQYAEFRDWGWYEYTDQEIEAVCSMILSQNMEAAR